MFLISEILECMLPALGGVERIALSGGLAQSDALAQLLADASELEVVRSADPEATSRGLARLCGIEASVLRSDRFVPRANPRLRERHARWREELERSLA